ncbi:uncharacterized protein TRAVEDRAFT_32048, partial [Trametes versicolor FP-101664 SS1]|uniref:uncharacterized protein n=1 Tax=Trametes versicolor (strain FP-101664) TaxID=717944 RepID=UPI00046249AC
MPQPLGVVILHHTAAPARTYASPARNHQDMRRRRLERSQYAEIHHVEFGFRAIVEDPDRPT